MRPSTTLCSIFALAITTSAASLPVRDTSAQQIVDSFNQLTQQSQSLQSLASTFNPSDSAAVNQLASGLSNLAQSTESDKESLNDAQTFSETDAQRVNAAVSHFSSSKDELVQTVQAAANPLPEPIAEAVDAVGALADGLVDALLPLINI